VLSLPVPADSFLSDNGVLYHPTPPPLAVVLENILPSVNTKAHLSRGLQQPSGLVQHCTALALCKCLAKYGRVLQVCQATEAALEEDRADGQWAKMRRDLEREVRHRVPEFQVVVAFAAAAQKDGGAAAAGSSGKGAAAAPPHPTKAALLAESAQRLLWMYHSYLPLLVAETRFDVGKLVQNFVDFKTGSERDTAGRLNTVRQLHVLRLLAESDQFVWSGKTGALLLTRGKQISAADTSSTSVVWENPPARLLGRVLCLRKSGAAKDLEWSCRPPSRRQHHISEQSRGTLIVAFGAPHRTRSVVE
jgi:nucleolar pre-ribosomal-associated protein 1